MPEMRRPQGELRVEFRRPVQRFGVELVMAVEGIDGHLWVPSLTHTHDLMYSVEKPGVDFLPLMHLTDEEAAAMYRAMNDMPVRFRGDAGVEHLADTIKQRDELMTMLATGQNNHHELAMQALKV